MNRYPLNANPIVSVDFVDDDGDPANPTVVGLVVTKPDATVLTYTTGDLVNPAVGTWEKTLVANQLGTWSYTFTGTGAVAATSSGSFDVGPGLDIISLAEAKRAVNIAAANTDHDTEMASYVTAVSLAMDELFGPIVQREVVEYHNGGGKVFLRGYPAASVVSVVERNGTMATTLTAEVFSAPTGNDYQIDLKTGVLRRRSGGGPARFAPGSQNIVVTYVAGRFSATNTVNARFKQGAAIMLAHLWRPEQGLTAGPFATEGGQMPLTFAVPNAVAQLLASEKRGPVCA